MSLNNDFVAPLKRLATVLVYVDERQATDTDSILISLRKLDDLVGVYESLYAFHAHHLTQPAADPPTARRCTVIIWMISAENYDVNYLSVSSPGTSPNTYVAPVVGDRQVQGHDRYQQRVVAHRIEGGLWATPSSWTCLGRRIRTGSRARR
ncbi:hypothetical protein FOPE_10829 [Fonsecaea pedrosoi]|nr:hypothetical protein FOPE_10829 [Fonsecaea pedrosoi]